MVANCLLHVKQRFRIQDQIQMHNILLIQRKCNTKNKLKKNCSHFEVLDLKKARLCHVLF